MVVEEGFGYGRYVRGMGFGGMFCEWFCRGMFSVWW